MSMDALLAVGTAIGGAVAGYVALSMRVRAQIDASRAELIKDLQAERDMRARENKAMRRQVDALIAWSLSAVVAHRQLAAELMRVTDGHAVVPPLDPPPISPLTDDTDDHTGGTP